MAGITYRYTVKSTITENGNETGNEINVLSYDDEPTGPEAQIILNTIAQLVAYRHIGTNSEATVSNEILSREKVTIEDL